MNHVKLISNIIFFFVLLFSFTGCINDTYPGGETSGSARTAALRIRVAAPDSRAGGIEIDPNAESNELMHTLRIVIVRPNGEVEYNRLIDFDRQPLGVKLSEWETFIVKGNEGKSVYTFANEASLPDGGLMVRSLIPDQPLPTGFDTRKVSLASTLRDMPQPLFMSRKVDVPGSALTYDKGLAIDSTLTYELPIYIIRASVKFSYNIKNNMTRPLDVSQILLRGMADEEYLLPVDINDIATSTDYIKKYSTPAGLSPKECLISLAEHLGNSTTTVAANGGELKVPPFYYHEAPVWGVTTTSFVVDYEEASGPYTTSITLGDINGGGVLWDGKFPNLPALPRNTHVIVNVTVNNAGVSCQVDVVPYVGISLNPTFGFDEIIPKPTPSAN